MGARMGARIDGCRLSPEDGRAAALRAARDECALRGREVRARARRGNRAPRRARALRHLLLAVPRPGRHRTRDDRPAGLRGAAVLSRGPAPRCAGRPLRRRDDARLGRDALVRHAGSTRGSHGDRGLHPRPPAEPARDARRRPARGAEPSRRRGAALVTDDLARVERRALVAGVAALVAAAIGAVFDAGAFYRAWLASWLFWLSVALGPLVIIMLHYLSGGGWGIVVRRIAEAAVGTLPVVALLCVPIAIGMRDLYVWARPDAVAADPKLEAKHVYLNVPFFLGRAVLYFIVWIAVAWLLGSLSCERGAG